MPRLKPRVARNKQGVEGVERALQERGSSFKDFSQKYGIPKSTLATAVEECRLGKNHTKPTKHFSDGEYT